MAKVSKAEHGTVAWVDLQTPDLAFVRKFYSALLGWSFAGGEDPSTGLYALAQLGGRDVAGVAKLDPTSQLRPGWTVYFAGDADETARSVAAAGGKVIVRPMDVMDAGRMAYFADPTGAHFAVWQARNHPGAQVVEEPGAMCWHEVYTRDLPAARAFYTRVFGLDARRLDAPGVEYWTLHKGPRTVCGAMQMTDQFPKDEPSHWNTYFAVRDADAAAVSVSSLGGNVFAPPFDTPFGRMTAVTDPFGAPFCLIALSRRPQG